MWGLGKVLDAGVEGFGLRHQECAFPFWVCFPVQV